MTTAEDVEIPKVGPVDKRIVIAIVLGAGGFVAYRYWRVGKSSSDSEEAASGDNPEFDDSGDPGTVLGAISPNNSYGIPETNDDSEPASSDDYGFRGTTNSQWTQYATAQLSQSDRWSYTDIVEALGAYLAQKPATSVQRSIISSAIAIGGPPPQGSFILVSAPDPIAPITPTPATPTPVADVSVPAGLKVSAFTATTVTIAWNKVSGATSYEIDIKPGALKGTSANTQKFMGLKGKTQYQFRVRAVSGNRFSQWSPFVTVKTK